MPVWYNTGKAMGKSFWRINWRTITIGIRREGKSVWEGRAPLTPIQVSELREGLGINFVVQPSKTRIFTEIEYKKAGALISEDLRQCNVIVGVKEVPTGQILPGKTYFCFSHTHKGQSHNMPMLEKFLNSACTLIDYELLTDEKGQRLVAFGKFAGYAGIINCLHGIGIQLIQRGYRTPFLNVALSHLYPSLKAAEESLNFIGKVISTNGLPRELGPILVVFTGNGNVSKGAQEMFKQLPVEFLDPKQVKKLKDNFDTRKIYGCVVEAQDYCIDSIGGPFSPVEYAQNPQKFKSVFFEEFAPYATAILNGIYWESRFPRLLTETQAHMLTKNPDSHLLTIADVSCDINGSIEITNKATTIEDPFLYFGDGERKLQVMSIDNLPAQFPRDATEYFGNRLSPIIKDLVLKEGRTSAIDRATITSRGNFKNHHKWLQSSVIGAKKKRVLVLGSGYVAGPVVKYLGERSDIRVTIGSNAIEEANKLAILSKSGAEIEKVNVSDGKLLDKLISDADVVISLVPATLHYSIAQACLNNNVNLVTASYVSLQMQSLHKEASQKKLLFLNEIGLDPGLDHLSAKKIIDEIRDQGKKIISFKSWCGGLPAPECADNPFGYKFSWSPRGVLLAAFNEARYLLDGKQVIIGGDKLLSSVRKDPFRSPFSLEGIPNRDSLKYKSLYGLESVETMLRGTLRYQGFCELMKSFSFMGFINLEPLSKALKECQNWSQVTLILTGGDGNGNNNSSRSNPLSSSLRDKLASQDVSVKRLQEAMEWLGLFSTSESFIPRDTMLDSFCDLLQRKLQYEGNERDMVIMQHEFITKSLADGGPIEQLSSSLIEYGQPGGGFSAMARTVGYPVAIAAEMILDGQMSKFGVLAPLDSSIYNPMLKRLESVASIRFKESTRQL